MSLLHAGFQVGPRLRGWLALAIAPGLSACVAAAFPADDEGDASTGTDVVEDVSALDSGVDSGNADVPSDAADAGEDVETDVPPADAGDTEPDGGTGTDTVSDAVTDARIDADAEIPDIGPDAIADVGPDTDPDTDPDADPDTAPDASGDASPDPDAGADSDAGPAPLLAISAAWINDRPSADVLPGYAGAGNAILELGETADLELTVRNGFGREVTVVQARLESAENVGLADATGAASPRVVADGGSFAVTDLSVDAASAGGAAFVAAIELSGLPTQRNRISSTVFDVLIGVETANLDDTASGDGDGTIDPGESLQVGLAVTALGTSSLPPAPSGAALGDAPAGSRFVRVSARSTSPSVEVVGSGGEVEAIAPLSTHTFAEAITFVVAPTAAIGELACLELVVRAGAADVTAWELVSPWCFVVGFGDEAFCVDGDGDLYGVGSLCAGPDCDDTSSAASPAAIEVCNRVDDDCDGTVDDGFDLATDEANCGACGTACGDYEQCQAGVCTGYCDDVDGDGFWGPGRCATPNQDCNDSSAAFSPAAIDACANGVDEDCDGRDAMCPTACDPLAQDCPIGGKCSLNTFAEFVCGFAGEAGNRQPCTGTGIGDNCAAGGLCIEWDVAGTPTCHEMCATDTDCSDAATICTVTISVGTTAVVDVCEYRPFCDPVLQTCGAGQRCDSWWDDRSPTATFRCLDAGTVPTWGDCSTAPCSAGNACINDGVSLACYPYCDWFTGAGCDWNEDCYSIGGWPTDVGVCVPWI